MLNRIFVFIALFAMVFAVTGVDFSVDIGKSLSLSNFQCLKSNGMDFAIIQTWQCGNVNSIIAQNVADAYSAGFAHVDVYIFMCPGCASNSAGVVQTVVESLKSQGVNYGMIWFDVEQVSGCWDDASTNANYVAAAVNQAVGMGVHIGIYSSMYEWSSTVGGYSGFTQYPLWYAHYDGVPNFNDGMYKFGGWTSPAIKQYNDQGPCFSVDVSWYPDSFVEYRAGLLNGTIKQKPIDMDDLNAFFRAQAKVQSQN